MKTNAGNICLSLFLLMLFIVMCLVVGFWREHDEIDRQFEANSYAIETLEERLVELENSQAKTDVVLEQRYCLKVSLQAISDDIVREMEGR